jgi:hypothetical protein
MADALRKAVLESRPASPAEIGLMQFDQTMCSAQRPLYLQHRYIRRNRNASGTVEYVTAVPENNGTRQIFFGSSRLGNSLLDHLVLTLLTVARRHRLSAITQLGRRKKN